MTGLQCSLLLPLSAQLSPGGARLGPSQRRLLQARKLVRFLVGVALVPLPPVVSRRTPVGHNSSCTAAATGSRCGRGQLPLLLQLSCY